VLISFPVVVVLLSVVALYGAYELTNSEVPANMLPANDILARGIAENHVNHALFGESLAYSTSEVMDNGTYFTVILYDEKAFCMRIEIDVEKETGEVLDKRRESEC
jgi:hypothetical protein